MRIPEKMILSPKVVKDTDFLGVNTIQCLEMIGIKLRYYAKRGKNFITRDVSISENSPNKHAELIDMCLNKSKC